VSFENLKLFRDIAQTRNLSRAAEMNGITPSAASQQVNEVERALGSRLLDRSTRPLSLTREGKLYHELCRDVLRRNEEFEAALDELKSDIEGSVRLAAIYSIGISEMSQLEDALRERLPNVHVEIEYLRPEKVYKAVVQDRVDLGVISYPEATREIAVIPWREEEMVLATAPSNSLAGRVAVTPSDFGGAEFITFDDDLPIAREIHRYLRSYGVEVNASMRFDNIQTIKEAVMLGSGVSLVPRRVLRTEIAAGRIVAVPLAAPGLFRPVGIIHRKKKRFHRAARALLELMRETPDGEPAFAG
jgi:DNA-binding transcriptional LysR family regulator